jgi:colanic acid/amylovoran biosynthesis glycosyltransferase
MKIAFVVDRFPALSETFVLNQITGLIDRGHDVDIFSRGPRDEAVHPDVRDYNLIERTHYWPTVPEDKLLRWLKGLGLLAGEAAARPVVAACAANVGAYGYQSLSMNLAYAAWPVLAGRRYDIIHCHFGGNGIIGMALRDMGVLHGRLVTAFHGFDLSSELRRRGRNVYSRLFRGGELFLPISDRWRHRLIELGCPPSKIAVHRMGVDCRRFAHRVPRTREAGVIRLVSIARLVEKKGIEFAIRACAELSKSGRRLDYTVVGDGPLLRQLERLVDRLALGASVHLIGKKSQPDVIAILNDSHLLVLPSVTASNGDEEGIPVTLMEALAMGLPVVATRHSGIPEVVEDGVSGILVPERDVEALAGAIAQMADHPERWPDFGRAGRDRILKQHDIDTLNDSLVSHYHRLLGQADKP